MSRIGAQRAVNNFSGGLVTEANELTFPENSLSKAINVELGVDGSIQTRGAFDNQVGYSTCPIPGISDFGDVLSIKKFYWKEKKANLIAYICGGSVNGVIFCLLRSDGNTLWALAKSPYNNPLDVNATVKYFDVGFSSDQFLFPMNETSNYSKPLIYSCKISDDGNSLVLSTDFSSSASSTTIREPFTGSYFTRSGEDKYYYEIWLDNGYRCEIWWGGARLYTGRWQVGDNVPIQIGAYTYYHSSIGNSGGDGPNGGIMYGVYRRTTQVSQASSTGSQPIRYRDFKGLPNPSGTSPSSDHNWPPYLRQGELSAFSAYNLYNAGWQVDVLGAKYVTNEEATTISSGTINFALGTRQLTGSYPSMCDAHYEYLVESGGVKALGLYSPFLLSKSLPYSKTARKGSHILRMGREYTSSSTSPSDQGYFLVGKFSENTLPLSADFDTYTKNLGWADSHVTSLSIIGGRAWYGVKGRDFNIAYSQINHRLDAFENIGVGNYANCYQVNDPNSEINNDILDTDGGTINLSQVGDILKIVEYKNFILLFADNGVWAISGEGQGSFTPSSYTVQKISEDGVSRGEGVLAGDDGVFYVSMEALKVIMFNNNGILTVADVSDKKIRNRMFEVAKEFNTSPNASLTLDRERKCLHVNYIKELDGSATSEHLKLSGQLVSLVYDIRLDAFYEWGLCYDNKVAAGDRFTPWPGATPTYYNNLKVDLGLIYDDRHGLCAVFNDASHWGVSAPYQLIMDRSIEVYAQKHGVTATADGGSLNRGLQRFPVEFEIPFDLVGDMSLSKSVQLMHIFQSADSSYFSVSSKGGVNTLLRPEVYLERSWDWDSQYSAKQELAGNIQYPEVVNFLDKKVLINKIRIPGSGRCLSLRFTNRVDGPLHGGAFKLLGYHLDINADSKP